MQSLLSVTDQQSVITGNDWKLNLNFLLTNIKTDCFHCSRLRLMEGRDNNAQKVIRINYCSLQRILQEGTALTVKEHVIPKGVHWSNCYVCEFVRNGEIFTCCVYQGQRRKSIINTKKKTDRIQTFQSQYLIRYNYRQIIGSVFVVIKEFMSYYVSQPFFFPEELLKINSTEIELMKLLVSPINVHL